MSDTATSVVIVFVFVIGVFIVPLIALSSKNDDIAREQLQATITEWTDDIRTKRVLTQEDYDGLIEKINNPNVYDVEIVVNKLDENPAKKPYSATVTIGDNVYYVMYTTQVLEALPLTLNQGDIITVSAISLTPSTFETISSAIFKTKNKNESRPYAQSSGLVN